VVAYDKVEAGREEAEPAAPRGAFALALIQILLVDVVFSLDSVITAVGMANDIPTVVIAMVLSILVILASAGAVSDFVNRHPSVKSLALTFLLLIGVMLVAEGLGTHVDEAYIYFAMAFSLLVEMLNLRYRKTRHSRLT